MSSGVGFLQGLITYVNQNEQALLNGTITFTLQPAYLKFLNQILQKSERKDPRLQQIESQVKHDDLIDLKFFLAQLKCLKIESASKDTIDKKSELDLSLFSSLKSLEIRRCKPQLVTNLEDLSNQLEYLYVHEALISASELLEVEIDTETKYWCNLLSLNCSDNSIPSFDQSMYQLTHLQRLDLSHNLIAKVEHCQYFYSLSYLDLGHNRITSTLNISDYLGNIRFLSLQHNLLYSTEGLERLIALEILDISHNQLSIIEEILRLKDLPFLAQLMTAGNSVSLLPDYTTSIFGQFQENLILDGKVASVEVRKYRQNLAEEVVRTSSDSISEMPAMISPRKAGKKKKGKKRVATIEEISEKQRVTAEQTGEDDEETSEFQTLVKKFQKEGGSSWLVIFNEMQIEQQKKRSEEEKERKKDRPTRKNQAANHDGDLSKSEENDAAQPISPTAAEPRQPEQPPAVVETAPAPAPTTINQATPAAASAPAPAPVESLLAQEIARSRQNSIIDQTPALSLAITVLYPRW
eukprot:TRINITY_DN5945_c0_g1_i1.p1 TRINITY_DN5945_c0_g1~~TRINITY_DN5945_c0_g1_i1.p1  ORF type:complete len:523 (+),score=130.76 TRINITY_DN5945_c0_g1_i1:123-1691(+)